MENCAITFRSGRLIGDVLGGTGGPWAGGLPAGRPWWGDPEELIRIDGPSPPGNARNRVDLPPGTRSGHDITRSRPPIPAPSDGSGEDRNCWQSRWHSTRSPSIDSVRKSWVAPSPAH